MAVAALSVSAYASSAPTFYFTNTGLGGTVTNLAFTEITISSTDPATVVFTDANGNGILDAGDTFNEVGATYGMNFKNGASIYPAGSSLLGVQYELWATFNPISGTLTPTGVVYGPSNINFYYDATANGIFDTTTLLGTLFSVSGGCTLANCVVNAGYDGTVGPSGVLTKTPNPGGIDFGLPLSGDTIRVDNNYDITDANGNPLGGDITALFGTVYAGGPGTTLNLLVTHDGSIHLQIPEPASLALLGIGILGLGLGGVRRKQV